MRDLILVTCTDGRSERIDFIRRHIRTLISQIDCYHWIVVEDGDRLDPEVQVVLAGWNSHYLHIGPTRDHGNAQRNLAFEYIREQQLDGIVYCLEEENLVYPALAAELRKISKVGIVPIGNLGPGDVERPIVRNGKLIRWDSGWAQRKYPVAKGGFAFDSRLIFDSPSPIWDWHGFAGETEFIDKLINSVDELDFSACHWNQVCLVFHNEPLSKKGSAIDAPVRSTVYVNSTNADQVRYREEMPPASEYAHPTKPRPRLALVGCGWFASEAHIPALQQLEGEGFVEVTALCSRSETSLSRASERFGLRTLKKYKQLDSVLADPEIDLVDLVLPIGTMPEAIRASVRAGKHIISEKPCAPNVAVAIDLLNEFGRLDNPPFWAVAENWRFKNTTNIAEQIVKSGRIGTVYLADFQNITSSSPFFYQGWRGSPDYQGGHLLDIGVHFIALLRQVVGEVDRVSASVSRRLTHLPPADSVTAVMNYANGAEGSFQLSFAASSHDARPPELTLLGSKGSLHVDLYNNVIRLRDSVREQLIKVPDDPWIQGGVYRTFAHCLEALRHGSPLRSSPSEALRDLAVIEAMLNSGQTGKPVTTPSLYPALRGSGRKIATFNGVWTFKPKHVVDCGSTGDVSSAVMEAVSTGLRVRAMGVANSWASELFTEDVCLRLRRLNRIHSVDTTRRTVLVEAGVRLGDLNRVLGAHGLSLPSLPFNPNVTVGGAVATGTHGTSPKWGTLSDFVTSMKVVLASGKVREFGPASPPEDLRAARVAVGMLGVAVELEFEAIAMPWVRLSELRMDLSTFLAQRAGILSQYEYVWGHWFLGQDKIQIECLETRRQPENGFHPYVIGDSGSWASLRKSPPPMTSMTVTEGHARQVWMSMQYGVALSRIEMAINILQRSEFAKKNFSRVVEMKFLKKDNRSFLGPNVGYDSVLFNIWWLVDENIKYDVFNDFENTMRELHAQPHWGKLHRLPDLEYMKTAYPSWDDFEAIRSRFDPGGTFSIFPEHRHLQSR
jgi:L-gulono-1,4-lactone dehydrogenase